MLAELNDLLLPICMASIIFAVSTYIILHPAIHEGFSIRLCLVVAAIASAGFLSGHDFIALMWAMLGVYAALMLYSIMILRDICRHKGTCR